MDSIYLQRQARQRRHQRQLIVQMSQVSIHYLMIVLHNSEVVAAKAATGAKRNMNVERCRGGVAFT